MYPAIAIASACGLVVRAPAAADRSRRRAARWYSAPSHPYHAVSLLNAAVRQDLYPLAKGIVNGYFRQGRQQGIHFGSGADADA